MKKHLFKGPTTTTLCKAMLMNFISNFERGQGTTSIDFIAITNGKESTYNRKMGRQLPWENFVASKV
jgi:hypothetical protein